MASPKPRPINPLNAWTALIVGSIFCFLGAIITPMGVYGISKESGSIAWPTVSGRIIESRMTERDTYAK